MMSSDLFSGWGIRTLAATEVRYNPMAYHNGTVWPHDKLPDRLRGREVRAARAGRAYPGWDVRGRDPFRPEPDAGAVLRV